MKIFDVNEMLNGLYETKSVISDTIEDIANSKPFGNHKFYIYSLLKEDERGKKIYHQPRMTMGQYLPGTTCIKVDPINGNCQLIWTLPNAEGINLYKQGKLFSNEIVYNCIQDYLKGIKMPRQQEGDPTENEIREIYRQKTKGKQKIISP